VEENMIGLYGDESLERSSMTGRMKKADLFLAAAERLNRLQNQGCVRSDHSYESWRLCVAYLSPMGFPQLYPVFGSEIGEKSAPVVGLNNVFGRFRQVSDVIEKPDDGDFKSGASADSATQAEVVNISFVGKLCTFKAVIGDVWVS
jgi:hypothetical protein